ncbi:MAG TPA: hypothetical protein VFW40_02715 [Capsulimonadaceae bacterium]|nr:hypothetical protein [Capsulimonadaceae bacterium]
MTRGEIKQFAKALLAEDNDAPGIDPQLLDRQVDQATNEICRATGCYYLSYQTDLMEGQQAYCAPPLYEIRSVFATLSDGKNQLLVPYTTTQLDDLCPLWRWDPNTNEPTAGDPICYIPRGLNSVWLYPVPNYSLGSGATAGAATVTAGAIRAIPVNTAGSGYFNAPTVAISDSAGTGAQAHAVISNGTVSQIVVDAGGSNYSSSPTITLHAYGLTFEGLAVPKDSAQSLWPNETDACPLPTRGHEAVAYRLASLRCLQRYAGEKDQALLILRQQFEGEYKVLKGYVESEAAKFTEATRYRAHVGNPMHVPYYPY